MLVVKERPVLEEVQLPTRAIARLLAWVLVAVAVSVPCWWQVHIQSVDLSSHLYNAWLVNQTAAGGLPGLHVATEYTNVLFDMVLSFLLKHTGSVVATERIAVTAAVEVFFWGCFAFVSATANRRAWSTLPLLLMVSYGAVFRIGFFNFYISIGFCLFALAVFWKRRSWWLTIALLGLACVAHFLPCIWAGGVIGYVSLARRLSERRRIVLLSACVIVILALAAVLALYVPSLSPRGLRVDSLFGVDQMLMWGFKYKVVAIPCFCLCIFLLIRRLETKLFLGDFALHLWALCAVACIFLPDAVWLPFYTSGLSYITIRLSLLCAILFSAVITPVPRFAQIGFALMAVVFFALSYVDERSLNAVEGRVREAVTALPPGARVISTIRDPKLYIQGTRASGRPALYRAVLRFRKL